jgi:hypothetical protein
MKWSFPRLLSGTTRNPRFSFYPVQPAPRLGRPLSPRVSIVYARASREFDRRIMKQAMLTRFKREAVAAQSSFGAEALPFEARVSIA